MTREDYEQRKAAMRASGLGAFNESAYPAIPGRRAYLYAYITAEVVNELAPVIIGEWTKLAIMVEGYLTLNTYMHMPHVHVQLAVSFDGLPLIEGE